MINVRYSLLKIALALAEKDLHSLSLLVVSPSDHGKTDTLRLFSQSHDGVWIVPPTSQTRMVEFFKQRRNITLIAVDEPYDWTSNDYRNVAMTCKHVIEGTIKAPRSNTFSTSVDMTKPRATGIVLTCNDLQYDTVRRALGGCGLLERSLTVMCQNSNPETQDYIENFYRRTKRSEISFKDTFNLVTREVPAADKKFIDRYFTGYTRRSVQWICRITPAETFNGLKPYLLSGMNNEFIEEEIVFNDV